MSIYSEAIAPYAPWTDRTGKLSPLRTIVFIILLIPAIAIFSDLFFGPMRPEPYENALHETGEWTVRFLLLSLAITPLRRIFRWNRIIGVRRMVGLAALAYALTHLTLYAAQENWMLGKVASEIFLRFYLTIGFVALVGLIALGATSFDRAIKAMGRRWTQLHMLVYPIGVLALWHYFLQSKADVSAATLMSGIFALLMLYRLAARARLPLTNPATLLLAGALAVPATAGIEYAWYALATNLPADRVFMANFNLSYAWRPAIWIGVIALGVASTKLAVSGIVWIRGRLMAKGSLQAKTS